MDKSLTEAIVLDLFEHHCCSAGSLLPSSIDISIKGCQAGQDQLSHILSNFSQTPAELQIAYRHCMRDRGEIICREPTGNTGD